MKYAIVIDSELGIDKYELAKTLGIDVENCAVFYAEKLDRSPDCFDKLKKYFDFKKQHCGATQIELRVDANHESQIDRRFLEANGFFPERIYDTRENI